MGFSLNHRANKKGAGYSGIAPLGVLVAGGQVFCGLGRAVLPEKMGARSAWRWIWAQLVALGGNGGILRFLVDALAGVGTMESEGSRQAPGFAPFLAARRKLGRLSGTALGTIDEGGLAPLCRRRLNPLPVADGRCTNQVKHSDAAPSRDMRALLAALDAGKAYKIPLTPMGSGVRATQSAGLNSQSACRPRIFASMVKGGGCVPSCALGLNKLGMLGRGLACVN